MPGGKGQLKSAVVIALSIAIIGASFAGGVYVGYERRPAIEKVKQVLGKTPALQFQEVDFAQFWEAWSLLEEKYVDREKIDRKKLIYGSIAGLVRAVGDPYTVYFPPQEAKQFAEDVRGKFGGIGAEIGIRKDILTIISPLKGSPAERAGLKAGDKILKINATSTAELSLEGGVALIRGEIGTKVLLTIFREGEEIKEVEVTRAEIVIPVLETKREGDGVFRIQLFNFNERSAQEFRRAVREFLASGDKKLILDLRGNPGGYLDSAVDIASWFIPAGEIVAREHFASGNETLYRSSGHRDLETVNAVVLIDQGSASASEILAGALRDVRGIKLVGQKSFGKGSVQEVANLRDGASLKVTIAKWLTPAGHSINEKGLEPDAAVEVKKEDADAGRDRQLEKAIELLRAME